MINSRTKGKTGELFFVHLLKDIFPNCHRNWQEQSARGGIDLVETDGWSFEIKVGKQANIKKIECGYEHSTYETRLIVRKEAEEKMIALLSQSLDEICEEKGNMKDQKWKKELEDIENEYPMATYNWDREDWIKFIHSLLQTERQRVEEMLERIN